MCQNEASATSFSGVLGHLNSIFTILSCNCPESLERVQGYASHEGARSAPTKSGKKRRYGAGLGGRVQYA